MKCAGSAGSDVGDGGSAGGRRSGGDGGSPNGTALADDDPVLTWRRAGAEGKRADVAQVCFSVRPF